VSYDRYQLEKKIIHYYNNLNIFCSKLPNASNLLYAISTLQPLFSIRAEIKINRFWFLTLIFSIGSENIYK
jgi:hypothetical protein